MAKEKPPLTVVGDVGGKIAIIVDDIIGKALKNFIQNYKLILLTRKFSRQVLDPQPTEKARSFIKFFH